MIDHALHQGCHQIRDLRAENLARYVFVRLQLPAIRRNDTEECMRLTAFAFVRERRVGPGQLKRSDLESTEG